MLKLIIKNFCGLFVNKRQRNEKTPKINQGFFREIELSLFFGRIRLSGFSESDLDPGLFH